MPDPSAHLPGANSSPYIKTDSQIAVDPQLQDQAAPEPDAEGEPSFIPDPTEPIIHPAFTPLFSQTWPTVDELIESVNKAANALGFAVVKRRSSNFHKGLGFATRVDLECEKAPGRQKERTEGARIRKRRRESCGWKIAAAYPIDLGAWRIQPISTAHPHNHPCVPPPTSLPRPDWADYGEASAAEGRRRNTNKRKRRSEAAEEIMAAGVGLGPGSGMVAGMGPGLASGPGPGAISHATTHPRARESGNQLLQQQMQHPAFFRPVTVSRFAANLGALTPEQLHQAQMSRQQMNSHLPYLAGTGPGAPQGMAMAGAVASNVNMVGDGLNGTGAMGYDGTAPLQQLLNGHDDYEEDYEDTFEMSDLKVEVVCPPGERPICGARVGDHFVMRGEMLYLPPGQGFSIYSLSAALPLLVAKQRQKFNDDWTKTEALIACPDPNCKSQLRVVKTGSRTFRHGQAAANAQSNGNG